MSRAWQATLDALEVHLTTTKIALAAGTTPPRPHNAVFPDEPLPLDLAARARTLVALAQELESTADARLARLGAALRGFPTRRVATRRPHRGSFVDIGA